MEYTDTQASMGKYMLTIAHNYEQEYALMKRYMFFVFLKSI